MQLLQSLSTKANVWHEKYGIAAKNLAKISVKTLIPGLGELLADGIDSIFEITDHKDHVKWNDQIDQHLATIQADQQQYLQLLETIESQIGSLLSEIAREFQTQMQTQMQTQTQSQTQSQELILKSFFDQSFSRNELQFIQLQQSLSGYTQNFQIVEQKLDGLYRKQIELAIDLKEGNNSLNDSIQALKNLYQDLSLPNPRQTTSTY
jgi:hypothetical protein